MKIGFSTLVCPEWDLEQVLACAKENAFDGVELRGLRGELELPMVPSIAADPARTRKMFADAKIECVCLGTSVTLTSRSPRELAKQKASLVEVMELANALGCGAVRLFMGDVDSTETQSMARVRIADALSSLVDVATRLDVRLLIENCAGFASSKDLWFVIDWVNHPMIQACWNQCYAMTLGERATTSIPRLGHKIGLVHLCDADFDEDGVLLEYRPLGSGQAETARQIEILRGLCYEGYLVFEWPKRWVPGLPSAEKVLPEIAGYFRARLDEKQPILSAYKGDKKAPRLARPSAMAG